MVFYTLFRTRGAHFSKDLVNLTGPKSYFEIKVSRKVGCALTCNEVYFVSLADNLTIQFSNLLKLPSGMENKTLKNQYPISHNFSDQICSKTTWGPHRLYLAHIREYPPSPRIGIILTESPVRLRVLKVINLMEAVSLSFTVKSTYS